jgi:predicted DNA-binding transcriptional regulator AlpA
MTKKAAPTQSLSVLTDPDAWMTVESVCKLLAVSRRTLDGWRKRADDPFPAPTRLPNGSIRYSRAEVAAWLDGLPRAA